MKNCFCLVAHKYDKFVREQWLTIQEDMKDSDISVFLLYDMTKKDSTSEDMLMLFRDLANNSIPEYRCHMFDEDEIRANLGRRNYDFQYYEGIQNLFYGNIMLEYMDFFLYETKKSYDYYWFVEWDVFYNGNWRELVEKYDSNDADYVMCSSTMRNGYSHTWYHHDQWKTTTLAPFKDEELYVTFNPIMRLSKRAMTYLDHIYSEGNSGFYEVFLGTVLKREGFKIDGFYEHGDLDVATFTWLPHGSTFTEKHINAKQLYHPIKHI